MTVRIQYRDEQLEIPTPVTVTAALEQLGLPPELYLVVRDGQLLDGDDLLNDGDTVRLVGVISGGSQAYPTSRRALISRTSSV